MRWTLPGLLGLALLGAPLAAQAEWRRAESDHFIVYGRTDKTLRAYVTMLEDFDDLLSTLHGRAKTGDGAVRKLPVYLVKTPSELRRVYVEAPDYTVGVYIPTMTEVFAVAVRNDDTEGDWNRGDDTALHEYVHHFMQQYYANAYPAWLVEGYAEYYMTASLESDRRVVGDYNRLRGDTLLTPGLMWIPAEDLLSKRSGDLGRWDSGIYYAQAWLLTHYILSDPKRQALLPRYLEVVRGGRDAAAAWKDVYGNTPAELTAELRRYLKRSLQQQVLPRPERFQARMTITGLTSSADNLLLEGQRLKMGVDKADREKLLAHIRAAAGKAPNDRFARLILARAETTIGDRAQGEAILGELLTADPNDEEALVLLGESHMATGYADETRRPAEFGAAAKLFVRAFKINPNNPVSLHGYADARSLEPMTDNLVNVRLRAVALSPQIGHLRLDAARALVEKQRFAEARLVLAPVVSNPHGGAEAQAARDLLKTLPGEAPA